ncbi:MULTISPECIES: TonB-dependent receptor plug domain-containing protein [Mesoflavibacter]|uniref:TonB-dependent receptor n=1 Tax=Mesoflavibacter profundi TaxID=2708110 RepID=A0ABT4S1X7_9FLAO|nr:MULTISPECIES: TonB-dependent receptor [Mesoflavibacter]MDA0178076.1 TonB-dependent receptor [Mesoflavibacter profundi]QIJ89037.1 TonB-dependent receptor [Mesoflavibacter sp. HG96]QIJ91765.1 TonB-dependent receptor [Mesoflavibacter sp. HG37]
MILNKKLLTLYFSFFSASLLFAQEKVSDTTKIEQLEEVIVTGQYNPQSIKKSVHNVIVIDREKIEKQAANNLADVLNFNLNLNIIPSSQTGQSKVEFFGLDAQYFIVMLDNVQIVNDNGFGNNIDLTQINLDDIERIEIVEGAMGVENGANSVSGVINIITKKTLENDWQIQAFVQEETVRDEYEWFDKGRHIQALSIGHNFNDKWTAKINLNRNDFAGFYNGRKGQNHYTDDGLRGYDWLPKTQLNGKAILNYNTDNFKAFYKFEYFNEDLRYYDATVRPNINVQAQTSNPSSTDRIFTTNRYINNLIVDGKLKSGAVYNATFSYQKQERDLNEFNYYIITKEKSNETDQTYQSSNVFFSKGTINNLTKSDKFNYQLGYETRFIKGFDTQASGDVTQQDKEMKQNNNAVFVSSEINVIDKLLIRPGVRYEYNSMFKSQLLGSLHARYLFNKGYELRGSIGSSYRTPNFEELYYYFVDSNHDVRGNQNLKPERGFSSFLNLKKRSWFNDISMSNNLKFSYIDLKDRIELAVVNTLPLQYQYINIDGYKLIGCSLENSIKKDNWAFNLGATYQGISRIMNNEANAKNDFLYALQLNTSATYFINKWNTAFTLLLKHNGKQQNYIGDGSDNEGNTLFKKYTTNAFTWMDASIKKTFLDKKIDVTLGARNLLDVTTVAIDGASTSGIHSSNNSGLLLGYGRSYYLKLLYNLNF